RGGWGAGRAAWPGGPAAPAGTRLGFVGPASVPDHDLRAGAAELERDRPPDPPRPAGHERDAALERAEVAHARWSASSIFSSADRLLIEIAFTLRSIRLTSPERPLPGPISTNVRVPPRMSSVAACVKRTGAVSWSTRSGPMRCADSTRAVTVDMNGADGSVKRTFSTAGRSRSAARATSGEWNAPETRSFTARRAPSSSASAQHSSTAPFSPETTTWPGQL